jgi:hypothetical protein
MQGVVPVFGTAKTEEREKNGEVSPVAASLVASYKALAKPIERIVDPC